MRPPSRAFLEIGAGMPRGQIVMRWITLFSIPVAVVYHNGGRRGDSVYAQQEFSPARCSAAGSTTPFSSPSSVNLFSQLACYHVAVNAAFGLTK
jgi:hypothetical protein